MKNKLEALRKQRGVRQEDLAVALEKNGENWTVLRWQAVPRAQSPEEDLPLWDGGGIP